MVRGVKKLSFCGPLDLFIQLNTENKALYNEAKAAFEQFINTLIIKKNTSIKMIITLSQIKFLMSQYLYRFILICQKMR